MLGLVEQGKLTLCDVVRTCATAPARIFGLGHKGRIAIGADADLLLVDMKRTTTIRNEDQLSKAARTPFAGRSAKGALVQTFLRGVEIARDASLARTLGQFLHHKNRRYDEIAADALRTLANRCWYGPAATRARRRWSRTPW